LIGHAQPVKVNLSEAVLLAIVQPQQKAALGLHPIPPGHLQLILMHLLQATRAHTRKALGAAGGSGLLLAWVRTPAETLH